MSDAGRKDFTTKAQEAITPDSSKSTGDKMKESVTDSADHAARGAQTDSSKSTSQSLADKTGREKDHHSGSTLDNIKDKMGLHKS